MIDMMSKIYLNNIIFAQPLLSPIQALLTRFIEEPAFQEYTIKLVKIALAMFFASCKNKKGKKPVFGNQQVDNVLSDMNENEILNAQKRALIIELVKHIIGLECSALNDNVKPLIVHVYLQLKQINQENKGIVTLLNHFGDTQSIV